MHALLPEWSDVPTAVIGMLHLPPLPGSPRFGGDARGIADAALRDAEAWVRGGADGLLMENFMDAPFYPGRVPPAVVSHMTAVACRVRSAFEQVPLGINVLRNDGCSALAIAHAVGGAFVRVNILSGGRLTDQGLLQGIAHDLMRLRRHLDASSIRVLADVDVKHSAPLAPRPLAEEIGDTVHRGLADAVIVSGPATGEPARIEDLKTARRAAARTPVIVGSGVDGESAGRLASLCQGLIVGSWVKRGGRVDVDRVRRLVEAVRSASGG